MREEGKEICKKPEDYIRPDIVEKCKTIMAYREAGKTFTWIAKEIGGFRNGDNLNSWFSHYTKAYESHGIAGKASYKYRFRTPEEMRKHNPKRSPTKPRYPISDFEREEFGDMLKKAVQNQSKRYAKDKVYALYEGDKNLADGTISQIAKKLGTSEKVIKWYRSPSCYKRRLNCKFSHKKGRRYLVEL